MIKRLKQREAIVFNETSQKFLQIIHLQIVMELVVHFDLKLDQVNVRKAFLNWELYERVHMLQPEGFGIT